MPAAPLTTEHVPSPVQQISPVEAIRQRLTDLARERSLLRQLLRVAVRREQPQSRQPEGPSDAA